MGDFTLDQKRFPTMKETINIIHRRGFRIVVTIQPFISTESRNFAAAVREGILVSSRVLQRILELFRSSIILYYYCNSGQANGDRTQYTGSDQIQNRTQCWHVGHHEQKLWTLVTTAVEKPRGKISIWRFLLRYGYHWNTDCPEYFYYFLILRFI